MLALLEVNTLRSYFGKVGAPGSDLECQHVVNTVFEKLEGSRKFCEIFELFGQANSPVQYLQFL